MVFGILWMATAGVASTSLGSYHVKPAAEPNRIDVKAEQASLFALAKALQIHLHRVVFVDLSEDRSIDLEARSTTPMAVLETIARQQRLVISESDTGVTLRSLDEPLVTLDVKEENVRSILKALQEQCGIRNLMIDPEVQGEGTFLFRDVPCGLAIRTVFSSLGLRGEVEPNSVLRVQR